MSAVGLITPTYSHDLERCALLCESVDRYVTSFARHYLIVHDEELPMFAKFNGERRLVVPLSEFLPSWLKPLPRLIQRKHRRFWWSFRAKPVSGWHVQQFAKIAAACMVPEDVACILDSDVVFFRPFDVSTFGRSNLTPLFIRPRDVAAGAPLHAPWVRSSHRLLGLNQPSFPADDFIGHIIFWNQRAVHAMTARIEEATELGWIEALCRARAISEYMLYGYFVHNNPGFLRDHRCTTETPCLSYWDANPLDQAALERMLHAAADHYVAFSSASFAGTSVHHVRAVLDRLQNLRSAWLGHLAPPTRPAQTGEAQVTKSQVTKPRIRSPS
jgi:hypothetical protein